MGPCMSIIAQAQAAAGGAVFDGAPEETYVPFDDASVAWLSNPMKLGEDAATYGETDEPCVGKSKTRERREKHAKDGLSAGRPAVAVVSPYDLCDDACGANARAANGCDVAVPRADAPELSVAFLFYRSMNMPIGKAKLGPARTVPCVVSGHVVAVDLFLKIDGKEFTDGHVIVGNDVDVGKNKKSIEDYMTRNTEGSEQEQWMDTLQYYSGETGKTSEWARKEMNTPLKDGSKPWGTIYSHEWSKHAAAGCSLHLPLIVQDTNSLLALESTRHYGVPLATRFAEALAKVGKGKHTFELRIRPRQTISVDGEAHSLVFFGGALNGDFGQRDIWEESENNLKAFVEPLGPHVLSANVPCLTAKWSMDVDPKAAANGISRKCYTVSEDFDDPVGAIEAAWPIRNAGPAFNEAKKRLGSGVQCVHLIPTDSNGYNGRRDMGLSNASDPNINEVCFFWACFKAKKGDGLQIRCTIQRPKLRNGYPTSGEWKFWGNDYERLAITEVVSVSAAAIDAAIERDAELYEDADI